MSFRKEFNTFAFPSETIKYLNNNQLITGSSYVPSYNDKLESILSRLKEPDFKLLDRLIDEGENLSNNKIETAYGIEINKILNASKYILHHRMQSRKIKSQVALKKIKDITDIQLDARQNFQLTEISTPVKIEESHSPTRLGLSLYNLDEKISALYRFRLAYHSLDDIVRGFDKNTEVEFLKLDVINSSDKLFLKDMVILNIKSLKPDSRYSSYNSWGIQLARRRILPDIALDPVNQLIFDLGKSTRLGLSNIFFLGSSGLTHSSIEENPLDIHVGFKTGIISQRTASSLLFEIEIASFLRATILNYEKADLIYTHELSKDLAIVANLQSIESNSGKSIAYGLGMTWYF